MLVLEHPKLINVVLDRRSKPAHKVPPLTLVLAVVSIGRGQSGVFSLEPITCHWLCYNFYYLL